MCILPWTINAVDDVSDVIWPLTFSSRETVFQSASVDAGPVFSTCCLATSTKNSFYLLFSTCTRTSWHIWHLRLNMLLWRKFCYRTRIHTSPATLQLHPSIKLTMYHTWHIRKEFYTVASGAIIEIKRHKLDTTRAPDSPPPGHQIIHWKAISLKCSHNV